MAKTRHADLGRLRDRIENAVYRLIAALDALDAPTEDLEDRHDQEDDPAESGIADMAGLIEQTTGEPSLGATEHLDQRFGWGALPAAGWAVMDGEATGTIDDLERPDTTVEAWQARKAAGQQALGELRAIVRRQKETSR